MTNLSMISFETSTNSHKNNKCYIAAVTKCMYYSSIGDSRGGSTLTALWEKPLFSLIINNVIVDSVSCLVRSYRDDVCDFC